MILMVLSIKLIIIMFIKLNKMSYTTVESQQITSKDGELSIDVFNSLEEHDESKLVLNCNSYLTDGITLNCEGGGISFNSQSMNLKSNDAKIQSKNFTLEAVNSINLSSLESINISALSKISLLNDDDGILYDIDKNLIKISNNEYNSQLTLDSNYINIGNDWTIMNNKCESFNLDIMNNIIFKRGDKKIMGFHKDDSIEISGDVYINGTLKFNKLESCKIKKLRLEDSYNILEFGNNNTKTVDWNIIGNHIEGNSELGFNSHSNTFTFKYKNELSNIKLGGLCVNNGNINILEIENTTTKIIKLKSKEIITESLYVENSIKCSDLEINGKKIIEHLGNIINDSDTNIENIIRTCEYAFLNTNVSQNLSIDKQEINISGYNRNIEWTGKLNIKNTSRYSVIKNIIFRNCYISIINCHKLVFENCEFQNTNMFSEHSSIQFTNSTLDIDSKFSLNDAVFDKCYIESDLKITSNVVFTLCRMTFNNNNKIHFINTSVIYQIVNNFITCKLIIDDLFISDKDIILNDNWINYISNNKSEYHKNTIIKSKNILK